MYVTILWKKKKKISPPFLNSKASAAFLTSKESFFKKNPGPTPPRVPRFPSFIILYHIYPYVSLPPPWRPPRIVSWSKLFGAECIFTLHTHICMYSHTYVQYKYIWTQAPYFLITCVDAHQLVYYYYCTYVCMIGTEYMYIHVTIVCVVHMYSIMKHNTIVYFIQGCIFVMLCIVTRTYIYMYEDLLGMVRRGGGKNS